MKKFLFLILAVPFLASAQQVPDFPMLFYGNATMNGSALSSGSIIRAYYGVQLAGQVTLSESGIYGYNDPIKQQLLVSSGTGTIRFTMQNSGVNSGAELEGTSLQSHPSFTSGGVVEKNFAFVFNPPAPPPPPPAPSGGGGGGGGGSSFSYTGELKINNGDLQTSTTSVYLYMYASGLQQMQVTNTGVFGNTWTQFHTPYAWTLLPGPGVKTVHVRFGSNSTPLVSVQDSIELFSGTSSTSVAAPLLASAGTPAQGQVLGASTFTFTRNLFLGSTGNDVTELQKRLTADGLYIGPITGYFGPLTLAAVKKFQAKYGLEQVGNTGPKTRAILNGQGTVLGATTAKTEAELLTFIVELQKQVALLMAQLKAIQPR